MAPASNQGNYDPVFIAAMQRLLADEGGYVDNPDDAGGPTKFGISQRDYRELNIKNLTAATATAIYWSDWWLRFRFGRLTRGPVTDPLAGKVFDLAVDMGAEEAVRCLQYALRAVGVKLAKYDGLLGDETSHAANSCSNREALMAALRSEAAGYYRELAALEKRDAEFIKGWLDRAYE
jgi:lysozyme family protein